MYHKGIIQVQYIVIFVVEASKPYMIFSQTFWITEYRKLTRLIHNDMQRVSLAYCPNSAYQCNIDEKL